MRQKKLQDKLLASIDEGISFSPNDEELRHLEVMEHDGLIREVAEKSYTLTRYGEMIKIMGYHTHEETAKFEKSITYYNPYRTKVIAIILLFALGLLLIFLLVVVGFDMGTLGERIWVRI